jgi:hypothetical protein
VKEVCESNFGYEGNLHYSEDEVEEEDQEEDDYEF